MAQQGFKKCRDRQGCGVFSRDDDEEKRRELVKEMWEVEEEKGEEEKVCRTLVFLLPKANQTPRLSLSPRACSVNPFARALLNPTKRMLRREPSSKLQSVGSLAAEAAAADASTSSASTSTAGASDAAEARTKAETTSAAPFVPAPSLSSSPSLQRRRSTADGVTERFFYCFG